MKKISAPVESCKTQRHGDPPESRDFVEQFISHYLRQCRLPGRQRTRTQFKACDFSAAARGGVRGWTSPPLCESKPVEDGIGGPRIYAPLLLFFDVTEASKADKERERKRGRTEEKWKKKSPNWCFVFVLVNSNMVRPLKRPAVSGGPISGAR